MHPLEFFLSRMACLKPETTKEQLVEVISYLSGYANLYPYPDKSKFAAFACDENDDKFNQFMEEHEARIHKLLEEISEHPSDYGKENP